VLYEFHKTVYLKFEVYDEDSVADELLGSCECTLSQILMAPGWNFFSGLVANGTYMGRLAVKADVV
jgi:hypothetical protein